MIAIGIDPGSTESAIAVWDGDELLSHGKATNFRVLCYLANLGRWSRHCNRPATLIIEYTKPYPMTLPNGRPYIPDQVMETAYQSGVFAREWQAQTSQRELKLSRSEVVKHLKAGKRNCGTKDSQVRARMIQLIGPQGTKKKPGPTYGVKADVWQALAVAYVWYEQNVNDLPF